MLIRSMGEPNGSTAAAGLAEWFRWVAATPHPDLDWRDRIFLEQRQAGWLAAKEQVFDMNRLERFPILNAAAIYARILGIDEARRRGSELQRALIGQLRPELLAFPFNPPDARFLVRHPHWVLRRRGLRLVKALQRRWKRLRAG